MKGLTLLLSLVLAAGLAYAGTSAKKESPKSHKVSAEVVSVDTQANTITLKTAEGKEATVPVEGKAADALKELKAGDKVTCVCRDNEKGEHQAISEIQKAKPTEKQ